MNAFRLDGAGPIIEGTSVFIMAMGIGILVWIVLLAVARRVTAARPRSGSRPSSPTSSPIS